MPPFLLLIIASVFGASAFFLAGYFLRPPRVIPGPAREAAHPTPGDLPTQELDTLRAQNAIAEQAIATIKQRCQNEEEARRRAEAQREAIEREQAELQRELKRREVEMKTLSDRLLVAEKQHHDLFESQEKTASLWQDQLDAAKVDRQKQEQAAKVELATLRAQVAAEKDAHAKLRASFTQLTAQEASLRRALDEARGAQPPALAEVTAKLQQAQEEVLALRELEARLGQAQEQLQAMKALEAKLQAAQAEAQASKDLSGKLQQAQEEVQAMKELTMKLQQTQEEVQALKEVQENLTATVQATGAELEAERARVAAATEAQRLAEKRLAELDRLAKENAELREAHAQAAAEVEWHTEQKDEAKDAKVELAKAQAKLVDLERLLEENRKLREDLAELQGLQNAANELSELQATHKQLRLDAELMSRRLQEMQLDQAELPTWRNKAAEAASLNDEVNYLRQREKDLEAQIYASGFYASREMPAVSGETLVQTPMTTMETNLHNLVGAGGPRTAVLADAQGFLIAGAGEHTTQEGLAAFAAVAGDMVSRARMLLPISNVEEVRVIDGHHTVVACHLFQADDQGLGVATLGPGEADPQATAQAIVDLSIIVSGKITDLEDPIPETPGPKALA